MNHENSESSFIIPQPPNDDILMSVNSSLLISPRCVSFLADIPLNGANLGRILNMRIHLVISVSLPTNLC